MFLETGVVDLAERCGDGIEVGRGGCVGGLLVAGGLVEGGAVAFFGGGDEVF